MEIVNTKEYKVGYITPDPNNNWVALLKYKNINVPENLEISLEEYFNNNLRLEGISFTVVSFEYNMLKTVILTGGDIM